MNLKELTFGVGQILRERVNGWAETDAGQAHVYPDHPPTDLARSSYPRATVDVISHVATDVSVTKDTEIGEALVDVTVYATSSAECVELVGDAHQAVMSYWEDTDANGDPYFETWGYENTGTVSQILTDEAEGGFTRYNKTIELEFSHATVSVT